MNAYELKTGDEFEVTFNDGKTERHLITGFKTYDSGDTGIETVRFIKSRNAWAKVPKAWITTDELDKADHLNPRKLLSINYNGLTDLRQIDYPADSDIDTRYT